jgi:tetratricopeptide (TPR) repeat protein/transcriptional regulator with XRE-family HTH domain
VFGDTVRANRQRLGMTQEELADQTGVSVRGISDIEIGRTARPRQSTVRLLADAFGLTDTSRDRFVRSALAGEPSPPTEQEQGQVRPVPAQLPADVFAFAGRDDELAELDALLAAGADRTAMVIAAMSGTAGVGKTALAVHWAHRVRSRFPDGQLYVNLRGYDPGQPMAAGEALARFLSALGTGLQNIPLDVDDRAARYRTETAGRRMLIVLDNASSVEQVRPLLPGSATCVVVVTSRDSLAGLIAVHGAHRLGVGLLPPAEADGLLRRLIGARVEAEPEAAAALAAQCARLPLALRVAAELAVSRPDTPLADLAAELADQRQRLDRLDVGDDPRADVSAVFSWSLRRLPPAAVKTFRSLGLHPGPDIDAYATAALANIDLAHARRMLDMLARAHLVHPTTPGRYAMHDLLRAYAHRLAIAHDAGEDHRAVLGRLLDYYLATSAAAMDRLYPFQAGQRPHIPPPTTPAPELPDVDAARGWLDAERSSLVAAVVHTATHGLPAHTVWLSSILFRNLAGSHPLDALTVHGVARDAARETGDAGGEADANSGLGAAHLRLGRHDLAAEHYAQALVLCRQIGDGLGQGKALNALGLVERRLGNYGPAERYFQQALELSREGGDRESEADALTNLGVLESRRGRHEAAAEYQQQSLELYRLNGDRLGEADALNALGMAEEQLGRYAFAVEHYQRGLVLFQQLGNRSGEAHTLDNLGTIHISLGEPDRAAVYLEQAIEMFREMGDREGESWALNGLGEAAQLAGRPADARTHHDAALTASVETTARGQQARAHAGLGLAHQSLDDPQRARHHYEQALDLYTRLESPSADTMRGHLEILDQA